MRVLGYLIVFLVATGCVFRTEPVVENVDADRRAFLKYFYEEELKKNYYWADQVPASASYTNEKYYDLDRFDTIFAAGRELLNDARFEKDKWSRIIRTRPTGGFPNANSFPACRSGRHIENISTKYQLRDSRRYKPTVEPLALDLGPRDAIIEEIEETGAEEVQRKVGFLEYCNFHEDSVVELINLFNYWHDEGVTDLVISLINDGGGRVNVAHLLASLIYTNTNETFIHLDYRDESSYYDRVLRFQEINDQFLRTEFGISTDEVELPVKPLNLKNVVFMVNHNTASASEMLIVGLKPHLKDKIAVVGSMTLGKGYGQNIKRSPNDTYEIVIINFRYFNSSNEGIDFAGIEPTIEVEQCSRRNFFAAFECVNRSRTEAVGHIIRN